MSVINDTIPIAVACFSDRLADVGVMVWTGLNHLGKDGGWQWSDGSPLTLIDLFSNRHDPNRFRRGVCLYSFSARLIELDQVFPFCVVSFKQLLCSNSSWTYMLVPARRGKVTQGKLCGKLIGFSCGISWEHALFCNSTTNVAHFASHHHLIRLLPLSCRHVPDAYTIKSSVSCV